MASAFSQRFTMLADQAGYSARIMDVARTFCPTRDEALAIDAGAHRFVALQSAVAAHIWHHERARCEREHGWFVMPKRIEQGIALAWTDHSAEIMAIAGEAIDAALAGECVA